MTDRTARIPAEHHFPTHDGDALFYRHWPATGMPRRGAIVLFHRGHEHGTRMAHLVDELALPDFDFFAWDARGHGRSPRPSEHGPGFATSVRDVQTFVEHIGAAHGVPERHLHLIAQGTGAVLIATWAHDHAPKVRGLTLAAPAFAFKRRLPFARAGLGLMRKLRGPFLVDSGVKARHLTHDPVRIAGGESDPLISRSLGVDMRLDLHAAAERVVADAHAIVLPVQLLIPGADAVVHAAPQRRFFERLGSAVKTQIELPGFFHDALGERERAPAVAAVRGFILERFDTPVATVDLREAHRAEKSHPQARPPSAWSPRGAYAALARAGLRLGARFSRGLQLGRDTGFDSPRTLDHIYRQVPDGKGALGRSIDKRFLNAIDCRGLRQRKRHVEELIREAMERLAEQHREVRIMDIAAGDGRQVLDAVQASPVKAGAILLRDPDEHNVRDGSAAVAERELQDIARCVQADAFDRFSLACATPRPTLAVVSGLYERFPDNGEVRRSLAGVGDAVEDRGYLVYTGQLSPLRRETMAHTAQPQDPAGGMRHRTQAELDQLVEEAGFRKVAQRVDAWGLFTVCLAIRTGP